MPNKIVKLDKKFKELYFEKFGLVPDHAILSDDRIWELQQEFYLQTTPQFRRRGIIKNITSINKLTPQTEPSK